MVLTDEIQKEFYRASMDASAAGTEEQLFGNVNPTSGLPDNTNELRRTRVLNTDPGTSPWPNHTTDFVKLTAAEANKQIGPNMMLKVMAGDMITTTASYYYLSNNSGGSSGSPLNNVVNSLINALLSPGKGSAIGKTYSSSIQTDLTANMGNFINVTQPAGGNTSAPKAYINIVFLDEQFKFINKDENDPGVGTDFLRVSNNNDPNAYFPQLIQKAPKNGWAFVYLSNESNEPVYFDNFYVSQQHGKIAEESHYYPYGLKISGISSRAVYKQDSKHDYQADFSEEEAETGWNEFSLRNYDPQIGRWTTMDPYDEFPSPYTGMGNNPLNKIDPDGGGLMDGTTLFSRTLAGAVGGFIAGGIIGIFTDDDHAFKYAGIGALIGAGVTYIVSSPLNVNVQFVPNWDQVKADKESHGVGNLGSAYFAAKIRSFLNEIMSLGKIVTITGDGFVKGEKYRDDDKILAKGTLTSNLVKYFDNHPNAKSVANAFTEFHSGYMGFCSNMGPTQFNGISQYFNSNSTFMFGNCSQYYIADGTSAALNGATVIGSYTYQLDLPFALIGSLSGNPLLGGQTYLVVKPDEKLEDNFLKHRVSQYGATIYDGRMTTHISFSGKITYRKISESMARKMNDVYYRLGDNTIKNIFSLILRKY